MRAIAAKKSRAAGGKVVLGKDTANFNMGKTELEFHHDKLRGILGGKDLLVEDDKDGLKKKIDDAVAAAEKFAEEITSQSG